MRLNEWLRQASALQREACAATAKTSVNRLYQIAGGHSLASALACRLIAEGTEYRVTPHDLRADYYPGPDDGLPAAMRDQARAAE